MQENIASENKQLKRTKRLAVFEFLIWIPLLIISIVTGQPLAIVLVIAILLLVYRNYLSQSAVIRYRILIEEMFEVLKVAEEIELTVNDKPKRKYTRRQVKKAELA